MLPVRVGFDIFVIIELLFYLCKIFRHSNYSRYNAIFLKRIVANSYLVSGIIFGAFLFVQYYKYV
jgi:hypothetical protein